MSSLDVYNLPTEPAARFKAIRYALGNGDEPMSQDDFGAALGLPGPFHKQRVSGYEKGKRGITQQLMRNAENLLRMRHSPAQQLVNEFTATRELLMECAKRLLHIQQKMVAAGVLHDDSDEGEEIINALIAGTD